MAKKKMMPPAPPESEGAADQASEPMGEPADESAMAAGMAAGPMHPGVEGSPMHRRAHNMPEPPPGY